MRSGKFALLAAAAAMAVAPTAASALDDAPRVFTMQGSWTLDAGDDYCRLAATFANEGDEIAFALERNRAENLARFILVSDAFQVFRSSRTLGYTFLPDGEERPAFYQRSETADGSNYFNLGLVLFGEPPEGPPDFTNLPVYDRAAELAFAANINAILIDDGLRDPVQIATGNLRAPMQALQACTDDLLRVWGLDYEAHQSLSRRATPVEPAWEWLSTGTIPFTDFPLLQGGNNLVRLMVDAEGGVSDCRIHWPTLSDTKNQRICSQLLDNASFEPALDAEGNAIASYWSADPAFAFTRPRR